MKERTNERMNELINGMESISSWLEKWIFFQEMFETSNEDKWNDNGR